MKKELLKNMRDSQHLISMISVESIIRMGYGMDLDNKTQVLDLCCGYGTLLKIWHENFGIKGVGVDLCGEFIEQGKDILKNENISAIELCKADVLSYEDTRKYDIVICSETFESIENTLAMGHKYLADDGVLVYCKTYSKVANPPKTLTDFEGPLKTLSELNHTFNDLGFFLSHLATDSIGEWERYISHEGRKNLKRIKENPTKENVEWAKKWYDLYFDYRRPFEGQALFGLVKTDLSY
jgi:ubiquinone/menaquinone biosynthesis C-methylase UbiE